jgi:hypothetical protein
MKASLRSLVLDSAGLTTRWFDRLELILQTSQLT